MNVRALLIDFDGTIVSKDILDVVCGIVGREEESSLINQEFIDGKLPGLLALQARINFLNGVSIREIYKKLDMENFLVNGAFEFIEFLNSKNIISILHSGNIIQILNYYQEKLNITYVVGSNPKIKDGLICAIDLEDFGGADFKFERCKNLLEQLEISPSEIVTIGDSPADKLIFQYSAKSIAINPKGGIENYADFIIQNDLREAIGIIESQMIDQ
jgi:phosphoserine phosphatase